MFLELFSTVEVLGELFADELLELVVLLVCEVSRALVERPQIACSALGSHRYASPQHPASKLHFRQRTTTEQAPGGDAWCWPTIGARPRTFDTTGCSVPLFVVLTLHCLARQLILNTSERTIIK